MNRTNPGSLLIAAALAVLLGFPQASRGQDDGFDVPDVDPRADATANPMQAQMAMMAFRANQLTDAQFDQWIFGNQGGSSMARVRLAASLKLKLGEVERFASLSAAQKTKLELAARGDVKRFFDEVENRRKEFQTVRQDQAKFGAFYQTLQPVQLAFQAGLFETGSIFARTLRKTLQADQLARYDAAARERSLFRYRAKVGLAVANLDRSVGLTADQRRRLTTLILQETRPPRKFGQLDTQLVLYQLARLDEAKVRPIFNEAQWNLLKPQLTGARNNEATLIRQGVLPPDGH
jgi:hypothetical protein